MSENTEIQKPSIEQEIDLLELAAKVWKGRKLIFKACGIAAVVGIIVVFSIPREYTTNVMLAPELGSKTGGGSGMGAIAAMAGINLNIAAGPDALSPDLYPEIVNSTPFLTELFTVQVTDKKGKLKTTLLDYLDEHQRAPWWNVVLSAPFKALGWCMSLLKDDDEMGVGERKLDVFSLTPKEAGITGNLQSRILTSVDKKTGVISLSVVMQDPLISAALADTVTQRLQNYITNYRTNKARQDLAYAEKLYLEAQQEYYVTQKKYAEYSDGNQNVILQSFRTEQTRLQNEMNLAYHVYTQMAQQLQLAKAKVQEITPVYTIVQPASVPLKPTKPNKMMILIGFIFLAGVGSVGWILFGDIFKGWKKESTKLESAETAQM